MKFSDKVKSMKASEIIMAMVEGLKNPVTKIDMETYLRIKGDVCYGCAATNTICNIAGFTKQDLLSNENTLSESIMYMHQFESKSEQKFVDNFECAINSLRLGKVEVYNRMAVALDIAKIDYDLFQAFIAGRTMHMYNYNYLSVVKRWEAFVNTLISYEA